MGVEMEVLQRRLHEMGVQDFNVSLSVTNLNSSVDPEKVALELNLMLDDILIGNYTDLTNTED